IPPREKWCISDREPGISFFHPGLFPVGNLFNLCCYYCSIRKRTPLNCPTCRQPLYVMVYQDEIRWSMNSWTYACLAVGLLLLAVPAGALVPDDITLSTNKTWLTAGSTETATITVNVTNSNDPVSGAAVDLKVDSA